jgi:hypothetical protein
MLFSRQILIQNQKGVEISLMRFGQEVSASQ